MKEIWKDIKGYEGLYQVSNLGRIKNKKTNKIKTQLLNKYGYFRTTLWKNNKSKNYTIHQIIARTFIPNPNNYLQINHKDENRQNNNVNNLEWCTQKYNNCYGNRLKKISKSKEIPVIQLDKNKKIIKIFSSAKLAEYETNTKRSKICMCCKNKRKTANGFCWEYYKGDVKNEL